MEKIPPQSLPGGCESGPGGAGFNLLLVTRNAEWFQAVTDATIAVGQTDFLHCGARDALARLAGTASHYSHVLVDRNDADGLLDELADIATEVADPDTDMFVLGDAGEQKPHLRSIPTASGQSVLAALMAGTPPRGQLVLEPAELQAALTGALMKNRYQPIVRIADRRPVGLEALVRLNHPKIGMVLPDFFVPQIEQAGLSAELTAVVCARAFADVAGPVLAPFELRIAVNFPLEAMLTPSALDRLDAQRQAAGLPADRIIVELTESRPVKDFPLLRRSLERLRADGYGIAIDDIGLGTPDIAALMDLPFTSLKLDKDLVQQVPYCEAARAFLAITAARARTTGYTVIAEGVETVEMWDQMAALGVDHVQGFLAARPLPVAAVPVWWDAWVAGC